MKMKNMRKKSVAILAGLAIAGTIGASAASLGGLGGQDLGADAGEVVSCDTDGVSLAYGTKFDPTAVDGDLVTGVYIVESVTVTLVNAACNGQDFALALTDGTALLGLETTGEVLLGVTGPNEFTIPIDAANKIAAEDVTDAALSISGTTV